MLQWMKEYWDEDVVNMKEYVQNWEDAILQFLVDFNHQGKNGTTKRKASKEVKKYRKAMNKAYKKV